MPSQRILILMSNTGGGHRASALALKAGFEEQYPGRFEIEIIDLLADHTFWPLNRSPQIYALVATRAPRLWGMAYSTQYAPWLVRAAMRLVARFAAGEVRSALRSFAPDLVISVHPLAQEITLHALQGSSQQIPFVTVVTDLATVHPLWLHPQVDACYVAADSAVDAARAAGIPAERIHLFGLPVRPAFEQDYPDSVEMKRRLGLEDGLPAALLMGGGDGIGPVEEIAAALDNALGRQGCNGRTPAGQLVIICGRNETLRARLDARSWSIPVRVLGFVESMPEWMNACDCVVTKAGPGTIAEALICGLPIIISGYIPGQEEGNIPFVVDQQAGAFVSEPAAIGHTVTRWFCAEAPLRAQMAANARRLGKPQATREIVSSIVTLLEQQSLAA